MKIIKRLLVLGFFVSAIQAQAQYELHYALQLQEAASDPVLYENGIELNRFFKSYPGADITKALAELKQLKSTAGTPIDSPPAGLLSDLSSIFSPSISQGDILVAVSEVLVSRAKQELAIAYFDKMRVAFETPKAVSFGTGCTASVKLRSLFPNLYLLIAHIDGNLNMDIGDTFKAAMQKDVKELEKNIQNLLPECLTDKAGYSAYTGLRTLVDGLRLNTHPAFILDQLQVATPKNDVDRIYNVLAALSNSALAYGSDAKTVWISRTDLRTLTPQGYRYYLMLIEKNEAISEVLSDLGVQSSTLKGKYRQFMALVSRFNSLEIPTKSLSEGFDRSAYTEDGEKGKDDKGKQALLSLVELVPLDKIESIVKDIISFSGKGDIKKWNDAFATVEFSKEFYTHISKKEYSGAALSAIRILDYYVSDDKMPKELMKYITLAADIAQADSAAQVKAIFESAIMPVGSYKVKRRSAMTTTINAYVGATAGKENLEGVDAKNSGMYISPFMPIGLETSWSAGTEDKAAASTSLFFQLIDLGGLMSYHLGENEDSVEVEGTADIKFKHVLSPGFNIMRGFKDSPLTLGIGANYSPKLREITKTGEASTMATAFRFGISLSVDIPLFQISVRGKKKK